MPAIGDFMLHASNNLPMHYDGQEWRVLGALQPQTCRLSPFSEVFSTLDETQWSEFSVKDWNPKILNQGQYSSCVGHGACSAFTVAWALSGQKLHGFSPTFIYGLINGGRDAGALVGDSLEVLRDTGICFMNQVGENVVFESQFPTEAFTTAKRFRILDAYKINSFPEMGTALTRGMVCVSGIAVGNNFSNLDSNGVAPLPDRVIGGHCLAHLGLKRLSKGIWVVETVNSWGANWGLGGYCYLQQHAWDPSFGFPFDAYAIGAVCDDPEEFETDTPVVTA